MPLHYSAHRDPHAIASSHISRLHNPSDWEPVPRVRVPSPATTEGTKSNFPGFSSYWSSYLLEPESLGSPSLESKVMDASALFVLDKKLIVATNDCRYSLGARD